jgi:glycosyltransferase involved in cell wall biosynthesis
MPDLLYKYHVAFSVTNCICFDQRVQKISEVVSRFGCDITIIGRKLDDCCEKDLVPFRTVRFRMLFKKGFLFYSSINLRLFFYLLFKKFDLLVANDLDTLLPNFLVSKLRHVPLVYDSHEYFTGVPELTGRPFVKWVWKKIERFIFPYLKYVMTVSDSLAAQYEKEYGLRPAVVRNFSKQSASVKGYSRQELEISQQDFLIILQGGGINIDKGGEELVEAISMTENVSLIIAGSGDIIHILKQMVQDLNVTERVRFIPKIPWNELIRYTKSADAGMSLEKNTNLNYRFSIPNKLCDYISAGIPVIASNLPEISKIVRENDCGIIIQEVTPLKIIEAIDTLRNDHDLFNRFKKNSVRASETLNWENESKRVVDFYKGIFNQMKTEFRRNNT